MTAPGQGLALRDVAQAFLDGVVAHFADAGESLPERRYLAPGDPLQIAWDCEQFVVALAGVGWGPAQDVSGTSANLGSPTSVRAVRHAVLSLSLVRCTPNPSRNASAPEPAAIQAAGEQYLRDAGLLSQALVVICAQVKQGLDPSGMVQPGVVQPYGPEGGFHGLDATVAITAGNLV